MSEQPPTQPLEGAPAPAVPAATETPSASEQQSGATSLTAPVASASGAVPAQTGATSSTTGVSSASGGGAAPDSAAAIRAEVEKEQALKDAQRRVRHLDEEVSKVRGEKATVEGERDAAGMWNPYRCLALASLFSLQSSAIDKSATDSALCAAEHAS